MDNQQKVGGNEGRKNPSREIKKPVSSNNQNQHNRNKDPQVDTNLDSSNDDQERTEINPSKLDSSEVDLDRSGVKNQREQGLSSNSSRQ